MKLLPFNPTPSFPSAEELAAILAPCPPSPARRKLILSQSHTCPSSLRDRYPGLRAVDAATLASQHAPRPSAGIGADLWDMFAGTHRPTY